VSPVAVGAGSAAAALVIWRLTALRKRKVLLVAAGAAAVAVWLARLARSPARSEARGFAFDPDRVAHFEAAGWRAYYDRTWLTLLRLIVGLCQEQFRIPFPVSLLAAYHVARAAQAWVPFDHDLAVVRMHYRQFYRLARRYSGLRFDPDRVADLEVEYNDVHRRLVGQPDKTEFVETMARLHSATFGLPLEQARESAEFRVLANNTVDRITGGTSTDVQADWATLEDQLRQCYRSIQRELHALA
jgi:hypothetical protein